VLPGMTQEESITLFEKIGATAIANQAILKCSVAGAPLTVDDVIMFVGDFVNPERPAALGLIERINSAIEEVIDCRGLFHAIVERKPGCP
jgi:hypothetical protein